MSVASLRTVLLKSGSLALLAAALSGCVAGLMGERGGDPVQEERLERAQALGASEPKLAPGDTFTFDNPGVTWTVEGIRPDGGIEWAADNGERQITAGNPLLPALAWESPTRGTGTRLISGLSEPMFPLTAGKTVTFRATVDTDRPPYAWEFDWACTIGDFAPITVPAGTFEAVPISCGRQTADELVFEYAPEVGNYVQLTVAAGSGSDPIVRRLQTFTRSAMAAMPMMQDGEGASSDSVIESAVVLEDGQADGSSVAQMTQDTPQTPTETGGPTVLGMITGVTAPSEAPSAENASAAAQPPANTTAQPSATVATQGVGPAVHLASYKDPANAEKGWRSLLAANGDQLAGTRPVIRQVDIPGRGLFYRLHAGPLASAADAQAMCRTLTQRGVYCKAVTLQ